jgi:UTP:GlnB (protein PII) uridylyltransferase
MDGLVGSLFDAALGAAPNRTRVVLGAVGGYGRGFLGWKSDLDLRFVTDGAPESIQPLAEAMLYPLWDAGVSVGHQVATVTELVEAARDDLPTATSLLDFRRVGGDIDLGRELEMRAFGGVFNERELPDFMRRLEAEVGERYRRFRLPAGARYQVRCGWIARSRHRAVDGAGAFSHHGRSRLVAGRPPLARRNRRARERQRVSLEAPQPASPPRQPPE